MQQIQNLVNELNDVTVAIHEAQIQSLEDIKTYQENIYDGIERPLLKIEEMQGAFIKEGKSVPSLDEEKKWDVTVVVKKGDHVHEGQIFATCPETKTIQHRSLIPIGINGTVVETVEDGAYTVNDTIITVRDDVTGQQHPITLKQQWPVRVPRPIGTRKPLQPSSTVSLQPIEFVVTIGRPMAVASINDFGTPSR